MERRVASDVDPDSVMDQQARPSSEAIEEAPQVVHDDALRSLKNKRKAKLEQLLRQKSKIHQFMDEECYSVVEDRMLPAFYQLLKELCDINDSLKETYQERKLEDDMKTDQDWFEKRLSALRARGDDIACRLTEVRQRREEARKANESLILQDIHERIGHGGRNHVLSTLRQRYWIPNAISAIRKILSSCRTCRRLHGATGQQQMADLPLSRVLPDEPPFTRTGVDCFGPFTIKRGRTTAKRYGVIFTCMATRAGHIEVAASLDTDSFINALRRFIARRGQVVEIHSDNGTNFVGAERELKRSLEEWNMSKIENRLTQSGIKWMFNPPSASHFGGVWERLIRSVRKVLSATLKDQHLDEEGLQTLLCEVEAILNSRPITTPSDDPNDLEALTPNHLLLLKTQPSIPQGVFQEDDLYSRRRWRQVQYMADLFWKRWVKEYLPELQRRQKWTHAKRNFVTGDIVLIVDESAPRNSWVIGRIIHTIQDERGLVRQVRIKTRTNEFDRPITKVCILQESE
ncbi:hypothetical protein Q8A73_003547 [Channa argus]|nr:hypothetical protein Q8A73_003547 [Channa argus]